MRRTVGLVALAAIVWTGQARAAVQWGGNSHWYEVFSAQLGISWSDARAAALATGGDLACMTSEEENLFVFSLVNDMKYWVETEGNTYYGPWLGGYQTPQYPVGVQDPAADWHWVTGEAWNYTNWDTWEPNDSSQSEENRLAYHATFTHPYPSPTWCDFVDNRPSYEQIAYVVEWSSNPVIPEPSTFIIWSLLGGLGITVGWWRRRRAA